MFFHSQVWVLEIVGLLPLKTNISPENQWLKWSVFRGHSLVFRGVLPLVEEEHPDLVWKKMRDNWV